MAIISAPIEAWLAAPSDEVRAALLASVREAPREHGRRS